MQKKIKIGVIPAAGAGERLGYLSNLLPKTLFPIYDRPILHHIIDLMESMGIEDIYIIVNYHKEKIKEYYKNIRKSLKVKIHFIEQKKLDGLANATLLTERYTKKQPFMVILSDECIIANSLEPMIELFSKTGSITTEAVIKEKDKDILRQTCSANIDKDGRILEIIEKPENPPYMIRGCGIYLFKPEIFNLIRRTPPDPKRKEKDITSVINNAAGIGKACGYFLEGYNININDYEELLKANILFKNHYGNN
ncbi:MAG: nucleotidyltransferase family protein [Actinomycetota bacterium]|nr:nucleotidyltransferase family protein [Actinomycetota bacterium]